MVKKLLATFALFLFVGLEAQAVTFEPSKDSALQVNGFLSAFYGSQKDETGKTDTDITSGGEETEVEFRLDRIISGDLSTFFEIEFASYFLDDEEEITSTVVSVPTSTNGGMSTQTIITSDSNDVRVDGVKIGFTSKKYGQFLITKNTDDPFERYVAESLDLINEFLPVSEASTSSSKDTQIQYISPIMANNMKVIVGLSKNASKDGDAKKSLVLNYEKDNLGFSVGTNENSNDNNTTGIEIHYNIDNLSIDALYIREEKTNDIDVDYTGIGLTYNIPGAGTFHGATQRVDEEGEDKRTEVAVGYKQQMVTGVTLYIETRALDKDKDENDGTGVGLTFDF